MCSVHAVFQPLDINRSVSKIDLLELDFTKFRNSKAMSIHHQYDELVSNRVSSPFRCFSQSIDFFFRHPVFDFFRHLFQTLYITLIGGAGDFKRKSLWLLIVKTVTRYIICILYNVAMGILETPLFIKKVDLWVFIA